MARTINHELFSPRRARPPVPRAVIFTAAGLVLAAALAANWDRLTMTDEDRFQAALDSGDFAAALEIAQAIEAGDPNSAAAHLRVASAHVRRALAGQEVEKSLAAARGAAVLASEVDPSSADAWRAVGYTYELEGKLGQAVTYYQKAIDASPKNAPALTQMGLALIAQGKIDAGERYLGLAVQADPTDPWARISLARTRMGQAGKSSADVEKLLGPALDSADSAAAAEAKAIISSLRLAAGKSEEAESVAREAVAISPKSVEANIALGEALYDGVFSRQLPWEETFAEVRAIGDLLAELAPKRVAGPYLALRASSRVGDRPTTQAYAKRALGLLAGDVTLTSAERESLRVEILAMYAR